MRMFDCENASLFNTKSFLIVLVANSFPKNPSSSYLQESNKKGPKPVFFIDFKNCLGII